MFRIIKGAGSIFATKITDLLHIDCNYLHWW